MAVFCRYFVFQNLKIWFKGMSSKVIFLMKFRIYFQAFMSNIFNSDISISGRKLSAILPYFANVSDRLEKVLRKFFFAISQFFLNTLIVFCKKVEKFECKGSTIHLWSLNLNQKAIVFTNFDKDFIWHEIKHIPNFPMVLCPRCFFHWINEISNI